MDWKEIHNDKKNRAGINELKAYFSLEIFSLFSEFSNVLSNRYNVGCAPAVFSAKHGWTFKFGRNNLYLVTGIYIADGVFYVNEIAVRDEDSLAKALAYVDGCYADFKANYDEVVAEKIARQGERTKQRLEREKQELAAM